MRSEEAQRRREGVMARMRERREHPLSMYLDGLKSCFRLLTPEDQARYRPAYLAKRKRVLAIARARPE